MRIKVSRRKRSKSRPRRRSLRGGVGEKTPYPSLYHAEAAFSAKPAPSTSSRPKSPYPGYFAPASMYDPNQNPNQGMRETPRERVRTEYPSLYQPESTYVNPIVTQKRTSAYPPLFTKKARHSKKRKVTFPYYPQLAKYAIEDGARMSKTGKQNYDPAEALESEDEMKVAEEEWRKNPIWYGGRRLP